MRSWIPHVRSLRLSWLSSHARPIVRVANSKPTEFYICSLIATRRPGGHQPAKDYYPDWIVKQPPMHRPWTNILTCVVVNQLADCWFLLMSSDASQQELTSVYPSYASCVPHVCPLQVNIEDPMTPSYLLRIYRPVDAIASEHLTCTVHIYILLSLLLEYNCTICHNWSNAQAYICTIVHKLPGSQIMIRVCDSTSSWRQREELAKFSVTSWLRRTICLLRSCVHTSYMTSAWVNNFLQLSQQLLRRPSYCDVKHFLHKKRSSTHFSRIINWSEGN